MYLAKQVSSFHRQNWKKGGVHLFFYIYIFFFVIKSESRMVVDRCLICLLSRDVTGFSSSLVNLVTPVASVLGLEVS